MSVSVLILLSILIMILIQSFMSSSSHIILLLLILESLMLVILVFSFFMLSEVSSNLTMFLGMLTFSACEAALGLSVLVNLMRFHGNDFINSISSGKWFA